MLVCLFVTPLAFAKDYSFTWSANPEPVEGYKLYYKIDGAAVPPFDGTGASAGPSPINVGKQTAFTITGLDDNTTYYFALTAYNGTEESEFSEIISVFAPEIAPVAVIVTTSQAGEAPFTLNFDGTSSTGTISAYSWTFGDGDTATDSVVSHIYQFSGTYTATLTVENASGLSHQASIVITVTEPASPPPAPVINPTAVIASSSAVGDVPFAVQFDGSASTSAQPPIVSYSWDFGDGAIAGGATVTHTYTTPGTYHAALTVSDSVGLTAQISTPVIISAAPIQQNLPPVSSFTANSTAGVPPLNVSFDGSDSSDPDGAISEYLWSFGDGSQALGVSPQHTFTAIADYTVTLRVTDAKGTAATSSKIVSVQVAGNVAVPEKVNALIPIINFLLSR
jgi:PKD repeat protein